MLLQLLNSRKSKFLKVHFKKFIHLLNQGSSQLQPFASRGCCIEFFRSQVSRNKLLAQKEVCCIFLVVAVGNDKFSAAICNNTTRCHSILSLAATTRLSPFPEHTLKYYTDTQGRTEKPKETCWSTKKPSGQRCVHVCTRMCVFQRDTGEHHCHIKWVRWYIWLATSAEESPIKPSVCDRGSLTVFISLSLAVRPPPSPCLPLSFCPCVHLVVHSLTWFPRKLHHPSLPGVRLISQNMEAKQVFFFLLDNICGLPANPAEEAAQLHKIAS